MNEFLKRSKKVKNCKKKGKKLQIFTITNDKRVLKTISFRPWETVFPLTLAP